MTNSVDQDQTAPIGAVSSGSTLFASILNLSVMLGNYLQQTTSADIHISISNGKVWWNIWVVELRDYMFLKVVKVNKFLKSSSRPFHNLMDEGIHDFCEM